jgi:hypothetical protein
MIVERLVFHHRRIEHHGHARLRVIDGAEWSHRAGLNTPDFAQQIE